MVSIQYIFQIFKKKSFLVRQSPEVFYLETVGLIHGKKDLVENLNKQYWIPYQNYYIHAYLVDIMSSFLFQYLGYCTCLTLIVIKVSGWKKNYDPHFPVKWWPFERLNGLYKLYFAHECNEFESRRCLFLESMH